MNPLRHTAVSGVLVLLACLLSPLVVGADVVELKSGERVEGGVREATATEVVIEVGGQPIRFDRARVRAIYFGTAPSTSQATQASSLTEALRALKGLQSVTRGGIALRDYATRVSDARIKIDQFLDAADVSQVTEHVKMAMAYYSIAANSWPTMGKIFGKPVMLVSRDDTALLLKCPDFKPYLDQLVSHSRIRPDADTSTYGFGSGDSLPSTRLDGPLIIWTCASGQIAEAEKLLR